MAYPLLEHIEYLTLNGRYQLFEKAIANLLVEGDIVADLGCGVGVLGMQCLKAGASKIYGIDSSDAIHLAREAALRSGLSEKYITIAGSTFATDLPERADLLICDHVGYFGFDYGIVDLMRDASSRMLRVGGRMIPDSLQLHVAGVSSDACEAKASAWSQPAIPEELRWLDEYARNSKYSHEYSREELCTLGYDLGEIDLSGEDQEQYTFTATLEVQADCRFDGIAGWFSAHLGGGVWMTNSPLDPNSIGRSQAFLPVKRPFEVKQGDEIKLTLRASSDGKLITWKVEPPEGRGRTQTMSTWASTILDEGDLTDRTERPLNLSPSAEAVQFVLSLVDGKRTADEIVRLVRERRPDIRPQPKATEDFVRQVLARNTAP